MRDDDSRFTGHVMPMLISADCPDSVDAAALGQLVADALCGMAPPLAADVAQISESADEWRKVAEYAARTGQPEPRRLLTFALAVHVDPKTNTEDVGDLMVRVYQAVVAQADAAHVQEVSMSAIPIDETAFRNVVPHATAFFRTRPLDRR